MAAWTTATAITALIVISWTCQADAFCGSPGLFMPCLARTPPHTNKAPLRDAPVALTMAAPSPSNPRKPHSSLLAVSMVATDLRQSQAISPKRSVDRRQRAVSLLKRVVAGVLVAIGHWPALLPVKENKSKSKDSSRMDEHEAKAREQWEAEAKNAAESARSLRRSRLSSPSNVRAEEENKSGVEFKSSKVAEHEAKAREQWQREARIAADAARIMRRYGGYVSATAPAPELKKEANKEAKKEVRKETKKEAKKEIKHSKGVGHETKAKAQWEAEAKKVAESTRAKRYREVASVPELKEARREVRKRSGANHEAVAQEQWEADAKNAAESARAFRLRETQVLKEEDQGWKLKGAEYQAKAMSQWESVTRTAAKVAKAEREKKEEEERKGREREEEQAKADLAREEAKRARMEELEVVIRSKINDIGGHWDYESLRELIAKESEAMLVRVR